jgi:tRNA pseudouridine38-40 synthase
MPRRPDGPEDRPSPRRARARQPERRPLERGELARAAAYKLVVEYEGTRYSGWQEQRNARTVAGALRAAIADAAGEVLDLGGAGRTDAGVHALAQVAHLRLAQPADPARLLVEVNERLPADVNLLAVERADPRFHARHDAESRSYLYQVSRRRSALGKRFTWWVPRELDVRAMTAAQALVVGQHDFAAFCQDAPAQASTQVVVLRAEAVEHGALVLLRFEASHFLWRMVRRLTGALVKVGTGELALEAFAGLVAGGAPPAGAGTVAEWTAPAAGLFLERVRYRGDPPLEPAVPAVPVGSAPR